jgi:hypothetical protein
MILTPFERLVLKCLYVLILFAIYGNRAVGWERIRMSQVNLSSFETDLDQALQEPK